MPNDTEFTLSLFDNTALSGWNSHALQAAAEPDDIDEADAEQADTDTDDDTPPPADPVARGSNFRLAGDRNLARGWPARARDNIAAIILSKELEQSGRAPTDGRAGATAALHRLRRDGAGAELLPPPRRG